MDPSRAFPTCPGYSSRLDRWSQQKRSTTTLTRPTQCSWQVLKTPSARRHRTKPGSTFSESGYSGAAWRSVRTHSRSDLRTALSDPVWPSAMNRVSEARQNGKRPARLREGVALWCQVVDLGRVTIIEPELGRAESLMEGYFARRSVCNVDLNEDVRRRIDGRIELALARRQRRSGRRSTCPAPPLFRALAS